MNAVLSSTRVVETPRRQQIALAWGAALILVVPRLIYGTLVPAAPGEPLIPDWLAGAELIALAVLWAVSWVWPAARPLRGFFLTLIALGAGLFFVIPPIFASAAYLNWARQASWGGELVVEISLVHLPQLALLALTLVGSGIGRRALFLARGNLKAPAQPARLLLKETKPWNRVVRGWLPFFVLIAIGIELLLVRPSVSRIPRALVALPAILLAAAINAFGEEYEFRSMILARLEPVLGPQPAIWMAAGLFGLMHYFGDPGGPQGVLLNVYLGWIAAKSMIETRGMVWGVLIHFIGDVIIYFFWAMAAA